MKKKLTLLLSVGLCALLMSCATDMQNSDASNDASANPEVSQEAQKLENGQVENEKSDDQADASDQASNDDKDLDAPEQASQDNLDQDSANQNQIASTDSKSKDDFADEENLDSDLNNQDGSQQSTAATDDTSSSDQNAAQASTQDDSTSASDNNAVTDASSSPVTVTGLDYKANENGGTVVISTSAPAQYTTEENNSSNQYIVDIQNATLPKKFSRPYNTKDFSGPIGLINAYQKPGSSDVRIILQLKKPTNVSIVQQGNSLVLVPGGEAVADTSEPQATDDSQEQAPQDVADNSQGDSSDETNHEALKSKTLDEFLMGNAKYYGKKISIEVVNGELRDVINFISEESGANIVLSDDVTGKISVKLRQIPWDQALVVIMQTKQLGYIREGNILRIATLNSIRGEAESASQLLEAQKKLEPLRVKIFPISYAKAKDLEAQVTTFLSTRGSAKADDRTNNLVVKDIGENIAKVQKLLQRLDTQPPQVYIEGKVVESSIDNSSKIGINWSTSGSQANIGYNLNPFQFQHTGTIGLQAALNLLESDSKVKILSAPHVTTLNNQLATISQSTQFPTYNTTTSATVPPVSTTTVTYITVHLTLNVTPQITADGGVILNTEILREIAGAVDPNSSGTQARPINSRSAKSSILVNNGQTAVLGGIYSMDNTISNGGIPILKDIPLIGWLFGQDQQTYDKNELLIFLTPRVINRDKAFQMSKEDVSQGESL